MADHLENNPYVDRDDAWRESAAKRGPTEPELLNRYTANVDDLVRRYNNRETQSFQ